MIEGKFANRSNSSAVIERVAVDDPRFLKLVKRLDDALAVVNGDQHDFYTQFSLAPTLDYVALLLESGEPAGCGGLRHKVDGRTELKRMYVREESRGKGYAIRILTHLERAAGDAGFDTVVLETAHNLKAANGLYRRAGYEQIDKFPPYVGRPLSVCYGKLLTEDR